jgi:hypothetical protein
MAGSGFILARVFSGKASHVVYALLFLLLGNNVFSGKKNE